MGAITPVSTSTLIIKDSLTCLTHGLSNIIIELVKIITMIYISTLSIIEMSIVYVIIMTEACCTSLDHFYFIDEYLGAGSYIGPTDDEYSRSGRTRVV